MLMKKINAYAVFYMSKHINKINLIDLANQVAHKF